MEERGEDPRNPEIIDTIKGKKGDNDLFYPVEKDGKPFSPIRKPEVEGYDNEGNPKTFPVPKGNIVDTEA
ncbi:hypothetical protein C4577_00280 [Candidatus Parcubacteria bacterium]|nr:MAG: hypothetical protein C4577_00280 [Candidatus Parcubacteria bacterium]